ncbi:CngA [Symbiodinium sp. CCMP2592]|nr:CngA [Symbiodinium sp. CCMP2592]
MDWIFFFAAGAASASIHVDYVIYNDDASATEWSRTLRMLRLMRLVRIARAIKLRRGFAAVQELLHSQAASLYLSFFVSLGQLLVLNHWMACAWFGVSWLNADGENWVAASGLKNRDVLYQYLSCILWSFAQLGVGEFQLPPTNSIEMLLCAFIAFRSLITAATLISTMGNLIAGLRKIREDETSEFRLLRRFLKHNNIPHEVGHKVTQFLQHQYSEKQQSRSADVRVPLLDLLSPPLFNELCFERYRDSLCKLKLVDDLLEDPDMQTVLALHQLARSSLTQLVAASGDVIFLSGKVASAAYLKVSGSLSYYRDDGVEELDDSRWITEVCLWTAWVYMGDLESNTVSDMLCLDATTFCQMLNQTYATQRAASIYAKRFLNVLKKQTVLTDVFVDRDHDLCSMVSEEHEPLAELPLMKSAWNWICPRVRSGTKRRRSSLDVSKLQQVVPDLD